MNTRTAIDLIVRHVIVGAAVLAASACTTMQRKPASAKKPADPYRVESEGKVPPLASTDVKKKADEEEKFEDLPVTEDGVVVEEFTPVEEPVVAPPAKSATGAQAQPAGGVEKPQDTMAGYRIQILASGNEAAARSVKESVEVSVGVPAYVELADGVYKVRVGDCPSRPEAEALLAKCRAAGYGDAWIATTTIIVPRKDRTP